jgi:hypothetical protein
MVNPSFCAVGPSGLETRGLHNQLGTRLQEIFRMQTQDASLAGGQALIVLNHCEIYMTILVVQGCNCGLWRVYLIQL